MFTWQKGKSFPIAANVAISNITVLPKGFDGKKRYSIDEKAVSLFARRKDAL